MRLVCVQMDRAEPEEIYTTEDTVRFRGKLVVEQLHFIWNQFQFPRPGEYAFQLDDVGQVWRQVLVFQFPRPGEYAFQLWSQGQCLAERRLTVRQRGDTP